MQKLLSIVNIIYFSFFSKAFYNDVYHNLRGKQIMCLMRAAVLIAAISSVVEGYAMWTFMNNLAVDEVINKLPLMTIKNEELQVVDKVDNKPIFIRDEEGGILVVIDDQAKDNKYQSENALVVIVNNGIFLSNLYKFKFSSMFPEGDISLTHGFIEQYWRKLLDVMKFVPIVMFAIIFIGIVLQVVMYSFFFGMVVLVLHKIIKKQEIRFEPLFRLGVFACLPAMVFSLLLPSLAVEFIMFCYFIFAYYSVLAEKISRS